jgi:putative transposase
MPRAPRVDVGNEIYHVINRANGRATIFRSDKDFKHFENLLIEAKEKFDMRILAYVLMPNHWHLVLYPRKDTDLQRFMQWLTLTHTQQYHSYKRTIGYGHLYQGRYKSFLVAKDKYLLQVIRYVEQNPLRAKLVTRTENWQWGSTYIRKIGKKEILDTPPIALPRDYFQWVNERLAIHVLEPIRLSVNKGKPHGTMEWVEKTIQKFKLELTTRSPGRPKKGT